MGDLQALLEFTVYVHRFFNIDLFQRGFYQIKSTLKTSSKITSKIQIIDLKSDKNKLSETNNDWFISKQCLVLYCNEVLQIDNLILFQVQLQIDSCKVQESIENSGLELILQLWFSEYYADSGKTSSPNCVSSRTLKFHLDSSLGIHYHLPVLFDYFHLCAVSVSIHGMLIAIQEPYLIHSSPKSKSNRRITSVDLPTMETILFGNQSGEIIMSRMAYGLKMLNNLSKILLAAGEGLQCKVRKYSAILNIWEEPKLLRNFSDELNHLIKLAQKINSEEELLQFAISSITCIGSKNLLAWNSFIDLFIEQESIICYLAQKHHDLRVNRFAEGFFTEDNPRSSLYGGFDSCNLGHLKFAECVRRSFYFTSLPPLPVECIQLDGTADMLPLIFEDQYQDLKEFACRRTITGSYSSLTSNETYSSNLRSNSISGNIFKSSLACKEQKTNIFQNNEVNDRSLKHFTFKRIGSKLRRYQLNNVTFSENPLSNIYNSKNSKDENVILLSYKHLACNSISQMNHIFSNLDLYAEEFPYKKSPTSSKSMPDLTGCFKNYQFQKPVSTNKQRNLKSQFICPSLNLKLNGKNSKHKTIKVCVSDVDACDLVVPFIYEESCNLPPPLEYQDSFHSECDISNLKKNKLISTITNNPCLNDTVKNSALCYSHQPVHTLSAPQCCILHVQKVSNTLTSEFIKTKNTIFKPELSVVESPRLRNFREVRANFCKSVCLRLYSELPVQMYSSPYFSINNMVQMLPTNGIHLVICVHGLDGNSADLRLIRTHLEIALPTSNLQFLMSECNENDTFSSLEDMTNRLVSEILEYEQELHPSRISFIGHSLGTILIRGAISHPDMQNLLDKLHTYLSLSGPHLGMLYNSSQLVTTGLWVMQKLKRSMSLLQLMLRDTTDPHQSFLYKLAKDSKLHYFHNILLFGSCQDRYVPLHSARIELCEESIKDTSALGLAYRQMVEFILLPIKNDSSINIVRYDVHYALPTTANSLIGRAAHIAVLDSELFIEKFLLVTGLQYFV